MDEAFRNARERSPGRVWVVRPEVKAVVRPEVIVPQAARAAVFRADVAFRDARKFHAVAEAALKAEDCVGL